MGDTITADALGIAQETTVGLSVDLLRRWAAAIDVTDLPSAGEPLPLLWHWGCFTPQEPTSALGTDGHPRVMATGPLEGFTNRMFAGSTVRHGEGLRIGEPATRVVRDVSAERKAGRSGELVIVTVRYAYRQGGRDAVEEDQTLVYRPPSGAVTAPGPDAAPPVAADGGWVDRHVADPVRLMRFSAATFNAHRIHYDLPYAREQEGYPDLVVHGPLLAVLLAQSALGRVTGVAGRGGITTSGVTFRFRAAAPVFADRPFHVVGAPEASGASLSIRRADGQVAMTADLTLGSG